MRTLYLRNVPDDVAQTLEETASREGLSLNALAVRELAAAAAVARNDALFAGIPTTAIPTGEIVAAVRDARDR